MGLSERFYVNHKPVQGHWVYDRQGPGIGPFDTHEDAVEYAAKLNERHTPRWVRDPAGVKRHGDVYPCAQVYSRSSGPCDGNLSVDDADRVLDWLVEKMNAEGIQ